MEFTVSGLWVLSSSLVTQGSPLHLKYSPPIIYSNSVSGPAIGGSGFHLKMTWGIVFIFKVKSFGHSSSWGKKDA